jgi:hypothetical protein
MEDFELDQSTAEKPSKFTVEVSDEVLSFTPKSLVPKANDPMDLQGAVMIPCSPENVVIARNYAEELFRSNIEEYQRHSRGEEEIISTIATHKFAELCVSDFLNSKGIGASVDLKMYKVGANWDYDFTGVSTRAGFVFHVKATDVSSSRRMNGPSFVVSTNDPAYIEENPKAYTLGCIISSDWRKAALLFCLKTIEAKNHFRSPMRFLLKKRSIYHITTRVLPHDDRWGCLRTLVKGLVQNVEATDDESLSIET